MDNKEKITLLRNVLTAPVTTLMVNQREVLDYAIKVLERIDSYQIKNILCGHLNVCTECQLSKECPYTGKSQAIVGYLTT